ncbi:MAG: Hydrogenase expression/formation protein HypD [Syntrophorhabdus sp. PtaU1.Bin002]|nr:MAG: Hydrogenase expression/formation protein HypD [Syntrophorhabdus sp. PtaU1.Bin002]
MLDFSDAQLGRLFLPKLIDLARKAIDQLGRPLILMEVCGTHTVAISRSGLRSLLADHMELRSGPGCPVCVSDQSDIDRIIALARVPGVIIATFGDMVRVPGTESSLEKERALGARVEICYSPREALSIAKGNPKNEVIFVGVGFETTMPAIALTIAEAEKQGLSNFTVLSIHKRVPPAMEVLLNDPELRIDGFILPGHVCTITGRKVFDFISSEYCIPAVIAGFEATDIMQAIYLLLHQIIRGEAKTTIGYTRLVHEDGNEKARMIIDEFFESADAPWRGFGSIPGSGMALRAIHQRFDAVRKFPIEVPPSSPPEGCACGEVLRGKFKPRDCPLFGEVCTPSTPVGPCMVSSEGACAAYYQYE